MAMADYRLCDVCGTKVFYDARLNYAYPGDERYEAYVPPPRVNGSGSHDWRLDWLGDWAVICADCAKTHKTIVVPIEKGGAS